MGINFRGAILIDGERLNPRVEENVERLETLRTMDGASTLKLTIHDPDRELLLSGALTRRRRGKPRRGLKHAARDRLGKATLVYGHAATATPLAFRLTGLNKQGSRLILPWEDEIVARMRQHTKPYMLSRSDYTRAQFIWSMAMQLRPVPVTYMPSRRKRQREAKPVGAERGVTIDSFEWGLLGRKPTKEEIRNINLVLEAAEDESAGERPTLALIEACIVEAPYFANPTGGDSSSVGILQLLDIHLGGSTSTKGGRRDIKLVSKLFLTEGFSGTGGAIALARKHPDWNPGQIAAEVQAPAPQYRGRYEEHRREADDILAAYGGASGGAVELPEDYLFWRGSPDWKPSDGPREDSWQAGTRLTDQVRWRLFTANNILYYITDRDLMRNRPMMTLAERPPRTGRDERNVFYVGELDFEQELGKPVSEITFQAPAEEWVAHPGAVARIKRCGDADGDWLTWSIAETSDSALASITLRRPVPERPEPAATRTTVQTRAPGEDAELAGSAARARIVEIATASMTKNSGHNYYRQPGALTADPVAKYPDRSDCSQWIRACYIKAGLPDPGVNTWEQARKGTRTGRPRPGDLAFPASMSHVELFIGNGKTIGHGSPPIDEWSVAGMRDYFGSVFFVTFDFLND